MTASFHMISKNSLFINHSAIHTKQSQLLRVSLNKSLYTFFYDGHLSVLMLILNSHRPLVPYLTASFDSQKSLHTDLTNFNLKIKYKTRSKSEHLSAFFSRFRYEKINVLFNFSFRKEEQGVVYVQFI